MKFDSKAMALSSSIVVGVISIICGLLLLIAPDFLFAILNYIAHGVDLSKISMPATINGIITGTAINIVFSYIIAYAFAEIYNRLAKE